MMDIKSYKAQLVQKPDNSISWENRAHSAMAAVTMDMPFGMAENPHWRLDQVLRILTQENYDDMEIHFGWKPNG